jgi:LPS O-antigen subunit length determinant protein (WzzB/FepE family)
MISVKTYLKYIKIKQKNISYSVIAFFILAFIYILLEDPQYDVSIVVNQTNDEGYANNAGGSALISLALGKDSSASQFYYDFKEALYSKEVTKLYDEKHGGMRIFFGGLYDKKTDTYKPMRNLGSLLRAIKLFFLGVDYDSRPNLYTLNDHIKGTISVSYDKFADSISVSSSTGNPKLIGSLIENLIIETDNFFKMQERDAIEAKISFLLNELNSSQSISQRDAISQILKGQLLKQALVNTDNFYKLKVVRGLETSQFPTSPNLLFTFLLFSVCGFMASAGLYTARYIYLNADWNSVLDS